MMITPVRTTKPRVSPTWRLLRSLKAYSKYITERNDIVRLANDPFIHAGNLAYTMAGRIWLHTLCGITYAVYPDPITKTLRHDVVILERHPPGVMSCIQCEEWTSSEVEDE